MDDLRRLRERLAASDVSGQRPTPATLAYLLHQSRPESYASATQASGEEPLSLVAAETACLYLAGLLSGEEFLGAIELLMEEEREEWAVERHSPTPVAVYRSPRRRRDDGAASVPTAEPATSEPATSEPSADLGSSADAGSAADPGAAPAHP